MFLLNQGFKSHAKAKLLLYSCTKYFALGTFLSPDLRFTELLTKKEPKICFFFFKKITFLDTL